MPQATLRKTVASALKQFLDSGLSYPVGLIFPSVQKSQQNQCYGTQGVGSEVMRRKELAPGSTLLLRDRKAGGSRPPNLGTDKVERRWYTYVPCSGTSSKQNSSSKIKPQDLGNYSRALKQVHDPLEHKSPSD